MNPPRPLSSLDAMFLSLERGGSHQHVTACLTLDAAPLLREGALDVARVRRHIGATVVPLAAFRRRLARVPLTGHPVWIDDDRFDLARHTPHVRLPSPGDDAALARLVGEVCSRRLPRDRPLWEMSIVEGLSGGRFAIVCKAHHAMLDGASGLLVLGAMLAPTPESPPEPPPPPPPPAVEGAAGASPPSLRALVAAELARRGRALAALVRSARALLAEPRRAAGAGAALVRGWGDLFGTVIHPASPTPLNPARVSPRRIVHLMRLPIGAARARAAFGATLNDVVLATVTGALATFLRTRGVAVEGLDVRAAMPVSRHAAGAQLGNAIGTLVAPLPLAVGAPAARLAEVVATTRALKRSDEPAALESGAGLADVMSSRLLARVVRASIERRPCTLVVSNIAGPPVPLYFLGARLRSLHPLITLNEKQGVAICFFTYDGAIHLGIIADAEAVPDLRVLAGAIEMAFAELSTVMEAAQGEAGRVALHAPPPLLT